MHQAAALLTALRIEAGPSGGRLEPTRVEALAAALGIVREELPALVAGWQKAGEVALAWGGMLEVLPKPPRPVVAARPSISRARPLAMVRPSPVTMQQEAL